MNITKKPEMISGICFIFASIVFIITPINHTYKNFFYGLSQFIGWPEFWFGYILKGFITISFAVSLIMGKNKIIQMLSIALLAYSGIFFVTDLIRYRGWYGRYEIVLFLYIVVYALLVVAIFSTNKNAQLFCYGCMGVSAIQMLISNFYLEEVIMTVALLAGYYFLGIYLKGVLPSTAGTNSAVVENKGSTIESLSNLKDLLDKGVITQEEFDAKKKQLLEVRI